MTQATVLYVQGSYYNEQSLMNISGLFLTSQYIALQLNSFVYVYPISNRISQQNQYYTYGYQNGPSNFQFVLLQNDYAYAAYTNSFQVLFLQDPNFSISNLPSGGDQLTLTGRSNANGAV
jgi:hypothetical protein